jgi:hypothetical protein
MWSDGHDFRLCYKGRPNLKVQHQITSTYLLQKKKSSIKSRKTTYYCLFFHVVNVSIQTCITSFYELSIPSW